MIPTLRQWWDERNQREQYLVGGGTIIIIVLLVYLLIWKPLTAHISDMRQTIQQQTSMLAWMKAANTKIKQYEAAGYTKKQTTAQPMLVLVEQSLMQDKLSQYVANTQQKSDNQIVIALKNAPFDHTINWLEKLWKQDNIVVNNLAATHAKTTGIVNLTVTLNLIN